jgi:hypothetical protein
MAETTSEKDIINHCWESLQQKTRLPAQMEESFEQYGSTPVHPESRRAYHRFYVRGKAILRWQETLLAVYTADASRNGIRFLSPVEIRPKDRARIRLPNTKEFQIEVVRCHRIDEECYDCGAVFVIGR